MIDWQFKKFTYTQTIATKLFVSIVIVQMIFFLILDK